MNKFDEQVLVIDRDLLFRDLLPFEGVNRTIDDVSAAVRAYATYHFFKRRGDVEEDASLKQLIPYVTIKRNKEYLTYRRLEGGGESRLHGKRSLGFGGHMNDVRGERFREKLLLNVWRELEEELDFSFKANDVHLHFTALINDDRTPTGSVHLGLAATLVVPPNAEITVRETDAHEITFMTKEELLAHRDEFENWSIALIDDMEG